MEWISVKDKLPKSGETIMIYSDPDDYCYYGIFIATFDGKFFCDWPPNCGCSGFGKFTHWMPLPKPPTTQE